MSVSTSMFDDGGSTVSLESIELNEDEDVRLRPLNEKFAERLIGILELDDSAASSIVVARNILLKGRAQVYQHKDATDADVVGKQLKPNSALFKQLNNYVLQAWAITYPWLIDHLKNSVELTRKESILNRAVDSAIYRSALAVVVQLIHPSLSDADFERNGRFHQFMENPKQMTVMNGEYKDLLERAIQAQQQTRPVPRIDDEADIVNWDSERSRINGCIITGKFDMHYLVNAGELIFTNDNQDPIVNRIAVPLSDSDQSFVTLIQECINPMLYLLKREQNLTDFVLPIKQEILSQKKLRKMPRVTLRLLVDVLLQNSDLFLRRSILHLLSKRNPVPFLEWAPSALKPNVLEISHIWDYSRPIFLSFGIGSECKGKSTLLNALFLTNFEESTRSSYFDGTVDVDFGYHFIPRRTVNFADAHGQLSEDVLSRIIGFFHGFLIHVQDVFLRKHTQTVLNFLALLPTDAYVHVLIRDKSDRIDDIDEDKLLRPRKYTTLPQIADKNSALNKKYITSLRAEILGDVEKVRRSCTEPVSPIVEGIQSVLISGKLVDYPLYEIFVQQCETKKDMANVDFYGSEDKHRLFDLQVKLSAIEENICKQSSCGDACKSFIELLQSPDETLTNLHNLARQLKKHRDETMTEAEKASDQFQVSMELHWRNAIICHGKLSAEIQTLLPQRYAEYINNGRPFEIIDGNNFYFQSAFLEETLARLADKKFFVLSIIGPQNSGKSTLLNYMFGTLFDVREGRCTRGVYGSLVKLNKDAGNAIEALKNFEYILLIDTEGLLSTEKNSMEYDRRLILFCLAVSHLIIVNSANQINATLKNMLAFCTDSLRHLGVNKVNKPDMRVVLNQTTDPNIENHMTAIKVICAELNTAGIALQESHFCTLPSAFKPTPFSNSTAQDTSPTFMEKVQKVAREFVTSAASSAETNRQQFCDLPRWIKFAATAFDILQKFPDLTIFNDVREREQNKEISDTIKTMLQGWFTEERQVALEEDALTMDNMSIPEFYTKHFSVYAFKFDVELEQELLKYNATDYVKKRSRRFLEGQINGIREAWCTLAINNKNRRRIMGIVEKGKGEFRTLIDVTIAKGPLTIDDAQAKFKEMWNNVIESIRVNFEPEQQQKKAFHYVYSLINIFEKVNLPEPKSILGYIHSLLEVERKSEEYIFEKIRDFYFKIDPDFTPIEEHPFEYAKDKYNENTINCFEYLHKPTILKEYHRLCSGRIIKTQLTIKYWDAQVHSNLKDYIMRQDSSEGNGNKVQKNLWKNIFCLGKCFDDAIAVIRKIFMPSDHGNLPITLNRIRQLIIEITQLFSVIDRELEVFKLSTSKHLRSKINVCLIFILTAFYYEKESENFQVLLGQLLSSYEKQHAYFLRMVVPKRTSDEAFAKQLLSTLQTAFRKSLEKTAENIISTQMKSDSSKLSRKILLGDLDSRVASEQKGSTWLIRYIMEPTEVLKEAFDEKWERIEVEVNRNISVTKSILKSNFNELFSHLKAMHNLLSFKQYHRQTFIEDIFMARENNILDDSKEKGQCMSDLLYCQLTGQSVPPHFQKNNRVYELEGSIRQLFSSFPSVNDQLKQVILSAKSEFDNISINNLSVFIETLIGLEKSEESIFDRLPTTLSQFDRFFPRQEAWEKSSGCKQSCPCCNRLCDFDHTSNQATVTDPSNRHRCDRGHQLRAMGGYRREFDNESSILFCEQMTDEDRIVDPQLGTHMTWLEFKDMFPQWIWPPAKSKRTGFPDRHCQHFVSIWEKVGEDLCKKYSSILCAKHGPTSCQFYTNQLCTFHQIKYVKVNTELPPVPQNHYILVLDYSGSMQGKPWTDLLAAVKEFMLIRINRGTEDLMTVINFATTARTVHFGVDLRKLRTPSHSVGCTTNNDPRCTCQFINKIDAHKVGSSTNFSEAFQQVIKVLTDTKAQPSMCSKPHTIIFMTDGQAQYPEKELLTLSTIHASEISRFWTMGLGSYNKQLLKRVTDGMKGELVDIRNSSDLAQAYGEIAFFT